MDNYRVSIDESSYNVSPSTTRKSASVANTIDPNIPILYQSIKAEIQNLLDKVNNAQFQDVADSANIIRFKALQLQPVADANKREKDEDQTFKPEILVHQLAELREQKKRNTSRALSTNEKALLKRQLSDENVSAIKVEKDIEKAEPEPGFYREVYDSIRRISPKVSTHVVNIFEEACCEDHIIPLEQMEAKFGTKRQSGLSAKLVLEHREKDGLNVLKPQKTTPEIITYIKSLCGGFGIILWAAVILCFIAYWPLGDPPDVTNLVLGFVILIVIFVQGTFAYLQQRKATNLIASFTQMMPSNCQVLRDGGWTSVTSAELVVGDVIRLRGGDKLPADIRLFEVKEAKIEKSSLTGENEPITLRTEPTDRNIYETQNMALFGTSMIEGTATGIVVNTGDRTIMGKIAQMASTTKATATTLQKEINHFLIVIVVMAVVVCISVLLGFFLGIKKTHPKYLSDAVMITNCIAIVVALLPDGLPIAITTILTLVAKRLHHEMILVKKLTVTETLGSATLIASDKTGTITMNQMTLKHVWTNLGNMYQRRKSSLVFDETKAEDALERSVEGCSNLMNMGKTVIHPCVAFLFQIMCLCNKSNFETGEEEQKQQRKPSKVKTVRRNIVGNPTEGALLTAADGYFETDDLRQHVPIVNEIPFSSARKFHLTLHQVKDMQTVFGHSERSFEMIHPIDDYSYIAFIKGAPEYILSMCSTAIIHKSEHAMTDQLMSQVMRVGERIAEEGERVIGFAFKVLDSREFPMGSTFDMKDEELTGGGMCFVGLAGLIDPPRIGVADAINECHDAGVRVMMVTGDHPTTAVAISRMVNIITKPVVKTFSDVVGVTTCNLVKPKKLYFQNSESRFKKLLEKIFGAYSKREFLDEAVVITGIDVPKLTQPQWDYVLSHKEVVFARTTPQHKLQIVKEAQSRGDIIAVTGDGVNDAPALKAANLGIAMGICGSDVSKEAANMVLLDDNFVTIVRGIKEGRLLYDNLKKVVCYLLPAGSFSEIIPVFACVFLGMPQPLSAFLMIVICVGTDMCGSLGLVHEQAESDIMTRPPRNAKTDRLVNGKIILFTYGFIGCMESIIAFFMYFLTMWYGRVTPSKLLFAYEEWGHDFNVTVDDEPYTVTSYVQSELNFEAQTAFFAALVITQLWNLFSVRTRMQSSLVQKFDPRLLWYISGEIIIMLLVCYLPVFNDWTSTRPLHWYQFVIPAALGSIIFVSDELRKLLARMFPRSIIRKLAW